jgi:hypothetical protein
VCAIHGGVAIGHLDVPPTFQMREQDEQIGRAPAFAGAGYCAHIRNHAASGDLVVGVGTRDSATNSFEVSPRQAMGHS